MCPNTLDKSRTLLVSSSRRRLGAFATEGKMKRIAGPFVLFVLLVLSSIGAEAQWDGAEIHRLTYNTSRNEVEGLHLGNDDSLFLFFRQWNWDPLVQPYRDTLLLMKKAKRGEWSEPEKIGHAPFDLAGVKKYLAYDAGAGVIHVLYVSYPLFGCAETLYYANSSPPAWEPVIVDSLEPLHQYMLPDLSIDSAGNAHVVWSDPDWSGPEGSGRIMYANNSTGNWVSRAVWYGFGGALPAILTVQKDGTAHIVHGGAGIEDIYYAKNDGLNGENWNTDTIPRPTLPLCYHSYSELVADALDEIHLLTTGYSCIGDTTFEFYYHKQADDSLWSSTDLVQVHPPDSGMMRGCFVDRQGDLHLSLTHYGGSNVIYTNNESGSWSEPELLLYEGDAPGAGWSFMFVIDSEGQGHGVFEGLNPSQSFWDEDSFEVYYFSTPSTAVDLPQDHQISRFKLFQNHPNPFNSSTTISYDNPQEGKVVLKVYDVLGREVRELVNRQQGAGHHVVGWDGRNNEGKDVASGVYFYQLRSGDYRETRKTALIR
jgi:hypothetical protein